MTRTNQIDLLKAGAIFSVLVDHAASSNALVYSWSALYIGQAVPIFMVVMGFAGQWGTVQRRLMRLLVPFALLWVVTLFAAVALGRRPFALDSLLLRLPIVGPGNYFVAVAIAICLLLPLFRRIAKKSALLLLAVTGGLDLAFELAAPHIAFFANHPYFYSAAFPRYLFCVGLGFWLATFPRLRWVCAFGACSLVYVVAVQLGWEPSFFLPNWVQETMVAGAYPAMLVALGHKYLPRRGPKGLATIGRASYHVFLFQMLFFAAVPLDGWRLLLSALLVCPIAGVLWWRLDERLFAQFGFGKRVAPQVAEVPVSRVLPSRRRG